MRNKALTLAFDTSAAHCAAALLQGDEILAARVEEMARGQAERLMPMLEEMLAGAGLDWRSLATLGVGTGPGNFTGIRISVAAARGLALALGIPARGVSMFETTQRLARWAQVAVPAPRGQFYLLDPDRQSAPILSDTSPSGFFARSDAHSAAEHAEMIARIAAEGGGTVPPAPLYLRGADAAPPSDPPPVILD